jgi:HEAT repeat protein
VEAKTIDSPEVDRLCLLLKSSRPNEVIQALKLLRRLNAPQAVPQILPCLNAQLHPNVIRDACRTLAVLGRKDIVPQIQPLLADNRADVRKDAQNAIFILQMKP